MATFTTNIIETFQVVSCYTCGVRFGIESDLYRRVVTDAVGSVYCPACGKQTEWRESYDKKRLREAEQQLQRERAAHDQTRAARDTARQQRDHQERRVRSLKGKITLTKKRVGTGKCPCCSKSFSDLAAHMHASHPNYASSEK